MPISLGTAVTITTSGASQRFSTVMVLGSQYRFTCTQDCWIALGTGSETASAGGADCHLCVKGQVLLIGGSTADGGPTRVSVIQDSAAGKATLSLVEF